MADYKAIHGKNILSIASDLDNAEGEGQIWFNTTSSDYKAIVKVAGAWSTGGNLNLARKYLSGCGTQTAAIVYGGAGDPYKDETEQYNGAAWSEVGDLNVVKILTGAAGVSTAALAIGGRAPDATVNVESWDNSSWTEIANIGTARYSGAACGTSTAALFFGGGAPYKGETEQWNGTSWTEVADLNTDRYSFNGAGTSTAALGAGGVKTGGAQSADNESWNGTSWTELADLNTARYGLSQSGTQDLSLVFGGLNPVTANTEQWDGSSWTEIANLATARRFSGSSSATTNASALMAGGTPGNKNDTEEWNFDTTLAAGVWASGGNTNTVRQESGGIGSATAGSIVSGSDGPGSYTANVESYDGSSWTEVADVDSPRQSSGGMGTQTAGLIVGGYNGSAYVGNSEEWNGTSWAEGSDANDAIGYRGTTGTQTAGLAAGGSAPTQGETEEYNGTSWTEVADYPGAKLGIGAAGTQTAAIFYGGSPVVASSFTYDGSSYSPVSALNTARFYVTSSGATETDAMAMGGDTGSVTGVTETWDGVAWTEQADLSVARGRGANHFQTATQSASLVAAGNNASNARVNTTEEYSRSQNIKVIDD